MNLLLINGSLRAESTNAAVVLTLCGLLDESVHPVAYSGLAELPHFNPDDDTEPLDPAVRGLRGLIAEADALLFCTPEYAGDLPGSLKNLLDWTVGGTEIQDKPAGSINASSSPTGAAGAHGALRTVLRYTGARIVDAACVHVPVPRTTVSPDGLIEDDRIRQTLLQAATTLLAAAP
jgi:NAD(P)H-dependent FMN reductase